MPMYEYECGACGHQLEKLQKVSDQPLVDCPHCHQATLSKLISKSGFRLKGTGWYETDFKTKKPQANATQEGKPAPESGEATSAAAAGESVNRQSSSQAEQASASVSTTSQAGE